MGYTSRSGRRPNENASKSAHSHVVKDPAVQEFLSLCDFPKHADNVDLKSCSSVVLPVLKTDPIRHVIAVDGGYQEVVVQPKFPSSTLCFFQFGALIFEMADLEGLQVSPFIDPADMEKLKKIQRAKLALPIKNIVTTAEGTLTRSVRAALYKFFSQEMDDGQLIETLKWLIFEEFSTPLDEWILASCPNCGQSRISLKRTAITAKFTFACSYCAEDIYLTDVLRLHEAIDDELGAGGILGYVTTAVEQLLLAHLIRLILKTKPGLFAEIIFIKDGPLGFFGQTANLHKPMRSLVAFLLDNQNLFLAGLEKSGAFVEHAHEIAPLMQDGQALLLSNEYIYKYIIPGKADPANPYGGTTYYGNKVIFKGSTGQVHVVTVPTKQPLVTPTAADLPNLDVILRNVEKLKCDMYDDSLVPVALVNKLVSLANHPSSRLLQKFAKAAMATP